MQKLTPLPPPCCTNSQGARTFVDGERGLHAETAESAPMLIFRLVFSGLTSVILVVLSTVNLRVQDCFRFFEASSRNCVMACVWSSCS